MKKIIVLFTSFVLALGLVGCSSADNNGVTVTGDFGKKPTVKIDSSVTPSKELVSKVLIEGDGAVITEESAVNVDYYGITWDGKEPFDESFSRSEPFAFVIGRGVIEGWSKGLVGKKIGSRVLLIIPPSLGYGEAGSPPSIPGNSTLVFVVDIHGGTTKKSRALVKDAVLKTDSVDGVKVEGAIGDVPKIVFEKGLAEPTERKWTVLYEGKGEAIAENDALEAMPTVYEWGATDPKTQSSVGKEGVPFILPVYKEAGTDALIGAKVGSRVLYVEPGQTDPTTGQKNPSYAYVFDIVGKVGQRKK